SRRPCRCGRRRCTRAARSGSAGVAELQRTEMEPYAGRDYDPIQPRGTDWRGLLRKIFAPVVFLIGLLAKLGSLAKFAAIFVALGCYVIARADHSSLMFALAYFGFFLNLINLLPFSILDGASVWRSTRWLWQGGGQSKALVSGTLYAATAILLAVGAYAAYLPQHRL